MRLIHLAALAVLAAPVQAQPRLSTSTEVQVGSQPGSRPAEQRAVYHQFNLDYALEGLQFGVRGEAFAGGGDRNYGQLLQRSASYRRGPLRATAGHFYTIVGSGLLAHAFELPGVIAQDRGFRRRYQIVRDLDGLYLRYRFDKADVLLLRGAPVDTSLPPRIENVDRRQGAIQGGSLQLKPHPHLDAGFSALHYEIGGQEETGAALNARLRLAPLLAGLGLAGTYADVYGEYAQRDVAPSRFFSLDRDLGRALYLAATMTGGAWGLSLEYKDYADFALSQINNPPTLIREHQAYLLNRNTHDLLADDERGYQAELSYSLPSGQTLTTNVTRASRRALGADDQDLREFFLQLDAPLSEHIDVQFLADFSSNQILKDEKSRFLGALWTWYLASLYTLELDAQWQDVDRRFGALELPYRNLYFSAETHRAPGLSAAVQVQRSTDALETGADPSGTTWWWGFNIGAEIRAGHSLNLFAGQRREGLACTAGTCYEVLGFEGVEARLSSRF